MPVSAMPSPVPTDPPPLLPIPEPGEVVLVVPSGASVVEVVLSPPAPPTVESVVLVVVVVPSVVEEVDEVVGPVVLVVPSGASVVEVVVWGPATSSSPPRLPGCATARATPPAKTRPVAARMSFSGVFNGMRTSVGDWSG